MSIQDLGSIGYLAYQIRLSTMHSRAFTQRDILKDITGHFSDITKVPSLVRCGLTNFAALNDDEKVEFSGLMLPKAAQFEATLRMHRTGLVDDDLFVAHRAWILSWLTTPGGKQWWLVIRESFSADVRVYIDNALDQEIDLPRPITESMPFFVSKPND